MLLNFILWDGRVEDPNTINSILDDICQVFPDEENENLERWTEDPESEVFDENEEYDEEDDGSDNFRDIFLKMTKTLKNPCQTF